MLLGVLVFAVDAFLRARTDQAGGGEIVVTQGRIENLAALFARTWQRPPTAEELRGLVDDYVLEEALYREGVANAVDRDGSVDRRRAARIGLVARIAGLIAAQGDVVLRDAYVLDADPRNEDRRRSPWPGSTPTRGS